MSGNQDRKKHGVGHGNSMIHNFTMLAAMKDDDNEVLADEIEKLERIIINKNAKIAHEDAQHEKDQHHVEILVDEVQKVEQTMEKQKHEFHVKIFKKLEW